MKLDAFADKLQTEGLDLMGGVFVHSKPADQDGVMLREYYGGTEISGEFPGWRKGTFQVIVSCSAYQTGMALAEAISAKWNTDLDTVAKPFVVPGISQINYLRPRAEPFVYPLSAGNKWEFLVNFDACYVL
jgi:hypothetical protein